MFQVASQIESIATRSDNTIKVVVGTQELPAEQAVEVFKLKGKLGWLLFKENAIEPEEVPIDDAPSIGGKSPSQRLYDRMLAYYMKKNRSAKGFNQWRIEQLDMLGQRYLDKLDELRSI